MALKYTHLGGSNASNASFDSMIRRFGVVTVMNAYVFDPLAAFDPSAHKADEIVKAYMTWSNGKLAPKSGSSDPTPLCFLDTLKVANITQDGPTKTVTGGQYSNPLIKYGKTARLEMQDALGNAVAIEALSGGIVEGESLASLVGEPVSSGDGIGALHIGSDFCGPKVIIGETFFIDQKSGQQVKAVIIFYQLLPDSIFNINQDAEGDAAVFDMNGDLLMTDILMSTEKGPAGQSEPSNDVVHGVFYSIVDPALLA